MHLSLGVCVCLALCSLGAAVGPEQTNPNPSDAIARVQTGQDATGQATDLSDAQRQQAEQAQRQQEEQTRRQQEEQTRLQLEQQAARFAESLRGTQNNNPQQQGNDAAGPSLLASDQQAVDRFCRDLRSATPENATEMTRQFVARTTIAAISAANRQLTQHAAQLDTLTRSRAQLGPNGTQPSASGRATTDRDRATMAIGQQLLGEQLNNPRAATARQAMEPSHISNSTAITAPSGALTSMLDNMTYTGFAENSTLSAFMDDVKAVSASQNAKTFQRKVNRQIRDLGHRAQEQRTQGDELAAMNLQFQAMQLQAGLGEWKVAADRLGHRQLMELYKHAQAPSVLGGINLFQLAISLASTGTAATVLASLLSSARSSGSKRVREEDGTVQCNYCKAYGHYKWDCPVNPRREKK